MTDSQRGDATAHAELLTLLAATARQHARNRLGDVPWLDDVAQEVLLTVHRARSMTLGVRSRPGSTQFCRTA